jgi:RNA polymerase sigma-70 factor, ECF subfamily
MPAEGIPDISGLLMAWSQGDEKALAEVMPAVYPELRRIARRHLSRQPSDHVLESAALANEAYLKLIRAQNLRFESRMQFFALCAQIIRQIVVDYARHRGSAKRGGGMVQIALDEALAGEPGRTADVLALDDALVSLAKLDARKARVVELRYFGGLSVDETAEALGISGETVARDWRMAKAWLLRELKGHP